MLGAIPRLTILWIPASAGMATQYSGIMCGFPTALRAASADVAEFRHDGRMQELIAVLKECLGHVEASEDSMYAGQGAADIAETLRNAIARLERGKPINKGELTVLFLPTGPLQDTSIDNGWGDEFVALAARFDGAI